MKRKQIIGNVSKPKQKTKVNLGIMEEVLDERASELTIEDPMTEE